MCISVGLVDGALSIIGIEIYGDRVRPPLPWSRLKSEGGTDGFAAVFPNHVFIDDEPHRIDAKVLRELAPGRLLEEWKAANREKLDKFQRERGTAAEASDLGRLLLGLVERSETKRGRMPGPRVSGLGSLHWKAVAEVYRDALERGDPPTQAVKAKWKVSKSAAAKWVAKCRALGLLPATSRGRPLGKQAPMAAQTELGELGRTAKSPFVQSEEAPK
jgi:hypothetical protein